MRYLSPLRYPGGKARLAPFFQRVLQFQDCSPRHYAEPFAGGAGAALELLNKDAVDHIHLNDLNPGIAAFWRAVLRTPEQFIDRILTVNLSVDEWRAQRAVYMQPGEFDDLTLGFATFYLNRTNRSGILSARPIGGLEQTGRWLIDARFNRDTLADRVEYISRFAHRISLTELDALDFLTTLRPYGDDVFVYADPPYLVQGDGLYMHAFDADAHASLAEALAGSPHRWVITYDDDPRITERLYSGQRCAQFQIGHTAQLQHVGKEVIIFSGDLLLPDLQVTRTRGAVWNSA